MAEIITRFGAAEQAYRAYRPTYPEGLFRSMVDAVPPPHRRAVDLGAGTGLSARPLAAWFDEVIAVEPDPAMARALEGAAENLAVRQVSAEEWEEAPASVDLVTSGNAFYWMDGPGIVAKVARWLRPDGMLFVYRYGFPQAPRAVRLLPIHLVRGCFPEHGAGWRGVPGGARAADPGRDRARDVPRRLRARGDRRAAMS